MNKQLIYKEIKDCTLTGTTLGFFAGMDILRQTRPENYMIPLVITAYGAVAGCMIGLGVSFINELIKSIDERCVRSNKLRSNPQGVDSTLKA